MPGPPARVYVHIGLPKTGTTYLQELLWHNRNLAAERGLLYPGYVHAAHFHAAVDLQPQRYRDWLEPLAAGAWDRLVAHVQSWQGTSIISSELFATASAAQVDRALATLAFAEVHIICTARDLARQIPSAWQENIRNRHVESFTEFLSAIRSDESSHLGDRFWRYQDLPRVLGTWARDVPPDRVHVVTVPRDTNGNQELWQRFAGVLGVSPAGFANPVRYDNRSLGATDTEVLRRLNLALPAEMGWHQYASVVKEYLAMKILPAAAGRQGRDRLVLPASERDWVIAHARRATQAIADAGYAVAGDLADLLPEEPTRPVPAQPPQPTDGEMLGVAVDALAKLVQRMPTNPDRDRTTERLKTTLREFSEHHSATMALRQLYWKGKAQVGWARSTGRRRSR